MKDLIKKQEEELTNEFRELVCKTYRCEEQAKCIETFEPFFKDFISKVRKETAEYVCDEIKKRLQPRISKKHAINTGSDAGFGYTAGYNDRIKEEKEIKKDILKELL